MNEFFGISMTYIMIGLLVILAIALASIGWVLVRNRIMFLVGVRNIPRRRAQTTLIIIGLVIVAIGLLWPWLSKLGLGRLPGDIVIRGANSTFYFPIVTCIVLSIAASLIFWLLRR